MDINGIGAAGYPAWRKTEKAQQNAAGKSFAQQVNRAAMTKPHTSIVYLKTDDVLYSGGNGTGLSFYIKYAEDSTEDDPTVIAKGVDENGDEFEKTIHINKINPKCATLVEMHALEAHLGVKKQGGLTSLPMGTGEMGLNDRANFMDMFRKQIGDMQLLSQKKAAAYYQYSMQAYWDFIDSAARTGQQKDDGAASHESVKRQRCDKRFARQHGAVGGQGCRAGTL